MFKRFQVVVIDIDNNEEIKSRYWKYDKARIETDAINDLGTSKRAYIRRNGHFVHRRRSASVT